MVSEFVFNEEWCCKYIECPTIGEGYIFGIVTLKKNPVSSVEKSCSGNIAVCTIPDREFLFYEVQA